MDTDIRSSRQQVQNLQRQIDGKRMDYEALRNRLNSLISDEKEKQESQRKKVNEADQRLSAILSQLQVIQVPINIYIYIYLVLVQVKERSLLLRIIYIYILLQVQESLFLQVQDSSDLYNIYLSYISSIGTLVISTGCTITGTISNDA